MDIAALNKDIDERVAEARDRGIPDVDVAMLDKVLRAWTLSMAEAKDKGAPAEEFVDSTFWILGVIAVEAILNTQGRGTHDEVYARMNAKGKNFFKHIEHLLSASVKMPKPN